MKNSISSGEIGTHKGSSPRSMSFYLRRTEHFRRQDEEKGIVSAGDKTSQSIIEGTESASVQQN